MSESDPPGNTAPDDGSLSSGTRIMAAGTLLSRLTGFCRILALAYALGSSELSDAYNLANIGPNIIYELVLGGVLAGTLVPVFVHQFTTSDEREAWEGVSAVVTATAVVSVFLSILLLVLAPVMIDLYGSSSDAGTKQREVAANLLRLFSAQVAFYGFISVATGLLHARRIFGPPTFAPIFNNLVVIAVLLSAPRLFDHLSLNSIGDNATALAFLGLGTTAGVAAMAILLAIYVRRLSAGYLRWRWEPKHPAVKTIIRMSGWTFGFVAANQVALFVTFALAYGRKGDLTAFLYAYTFFILPHGIIAVSVINALQPNLATAWAGGKHVEFRHQVVLGIRLIAFLIIPAAVGYSLLAEPLVHAVIYHGSFDLESANMTADLVFLMALGLPGFSLFIFFIRAHQAMHDGRSVFFLYVLQNGLNIATAFAFYPSMGVNGLALSQSVAYAVAAIAAVGAIQRRTGGLPGRELATALGAIGVASLGLAAAVLGSRLLLEGSSMAILLLAFCAGTLSYVAIARLLRISELRIILRRGA